MSIDREKLRNNLKDFLLLDDEEISCAMETIEVLKCLVSNISESDSDPLKTNAEELKKEIKDYIF